MTYNYQKIKTATRYELAKMWEVIDEEEFFDFLGAVPPVWQGQGGFMVGEPLCESKMGFGTIYILCVETYGKHYKRPAPYIFVDKEDYKMEIHNFNLPVLIAYTCDICKTHASRRLHGVFSSLSALKESITEAIDKRGLFEPTGDFESAETCKEINDNVDFIFVEEVSLDATP